LTITLALSLGLGLVFNEVCMPLYHSVLARTIVVYLRACSLVRPQQPRLWCGCHHVPEGTRPAAVWPEAR
jgi:hypothetical protein